MKSYAADVILGEAKDVLLVTDSGGNATVRETPAEYTKRMLDYTRNQDALKIQQSTAKKIERAIRGSTRKQLITRPAPDKWSIGEILAHLAEAGLVGGYRTRLTLGANGTAIQASDQDVWARNSDYAHQDPHQSLKMFEVLREANLRLLRSIPKGLWNNYGMHQERGKETIARVARMFAGHDINHTGQIQAIAKGLTH